MIIMVRVASLAVLWLLAEVACSGLRREVERLQDTRGATITRILFGIETSCERSSWTRLPLVGTLPHLYELYSRRRLLVAGYFPAVGASCGDGVTKVALALGALILLAWGFLPRCFHELTQEDEALQQPSLRCRCWASRRRLAPSLGVLERHTSLLRLAPSLGALVRYTSRWRLEFLGKWCLTLRAFEELLRRLGHITFWYVYQVEGQVLEGLESSQTTRLQYQWFGAPPPSSENTSDPEAKLTLLLKKREEKEKEENGLQEEKILAKDKNILAKDKNILAKDEKLAKEVMKQAKEDEALKMKKTRKETNGVMFRLGVCFTNIICSLIFILLVLWTGSVLLSIFPLLILAYILGAMFPGVATLLFNIVMVILIASIALVFIVLLPFILFAMILVHFFPIETLSPAVEKMERWADRCRRPLERASS
ncbi:uncharacterized protein [Procambarus clarkii]|uniref:uncharacterized protein n=1 Tax=Procambarus clarkii TaxID=6728 RepID=UPI003742860A